MTAFSSIYTSLTGMLSYSDALNSVSDDIANLNTPGFKGDELLFRDLAPSDIELPDGNGTTTLYQEGNGTLFSGTERDFSQGPFQSTGNSTDLSINGNGFFILNDNGQQVFSQAGQFTFDSNGFLIDSVTKARVQGYETAGGPLGNLVVNPNQTNPSVTTTTVTFTGALDLPASTSTGTATPATATVSNVIDSKGVSHTLTFTFTQATALDNGQPLQTDETAWTVTVGDSTGGSPTLITGQDQVEFLSDNLQTNTLPLTLEDGTQVTLNFGSASGTGVTQAEGGTSSISGTANGTALGKLTGITVDSNGFLNLAFSNGVNTKEGQVALASFSNPQELKSLGKSLFAADDTLTGATPQFGVPGGGNLGQIQAGQLELSNVNLSDEFSTIVVLQNGYQGSSQILNVANEMLSDLYHSLGGGGGGSS